MCSKHSARCFEVWEVVRHTERWALPSGDHRPGASTSVHHWGQHKGRRPPAVLVGVHDAQGACSVQRGERSHGHHPFKKTERSPRCPPGGCHRGATQHARRQMRCTLRRPWEPRTGSRASVALHMQLPHSGNMGTAYLGPDPDGALVFGEQPPVGQGVTAAGNLRKPVAIHMPTDYVNGGVGECTRAEVPRSSSAAIRRLCP